jgi:hypothetical protein
VIVLAVFSCRKMKLAIFLRKSLRLVLVGRLWLVPLFDVVHDGS